MQDVQGRRIQGDQGVLKQRRRSLQQVGDVTVVETADALQEAVVAGMAHIEIRACLLYTSPSPRDRQKSRMPSSA